ncbi:MAG: shikimate dehydrogenase [Desulfuromonas sp.]|nr:shikimate dehydrogenase [Desulfuromonas sp.]
MKIDGTTQIYGIIGDPVAHSLSPVMQNAAFAACGIDAVYVPFHVASAGLAAAVAGMRALGVQGINVTIPHKESILPLLDAVDRGAELIGAVNTVINKSGTLVGYNTDGLGLLHSLQSDLQVVLSAETEVIILGAGGAARAAIVTIAQQGVRSITILNRSEQRAQALVARYSAQFPQVTFRSAAYITNRGATGDTGCGSSAYLRSTSEAQTTEYFKKCHLIVNSTSIGLSGESFNVIPWKNVNKTAVVYDMIYAAHATPLVRAATEAGFVACDGLGMLAAQGEAAFELWTGKSAVGLMRTVLEQQVADCAPR